MCAAYHRMQPRASSSGWKEAMRATVDWDGRHRIQRSSTADMEEESATGRKWNPTFLKILCTVKLSFAKKDFVLEYPHSSLPA